MQKFKSLYKSITSTFLGVDSLEGVKGFSPGKVDSTFFVHYEEVRIHKLFSYIDKGQEVEIFFLEKGDLFSLSKYAVKKKGRIEYVKVYKNSYKELPYFCTDLKVLIPQEVKSFLMQPLLILKDKEKISKSEPATQKSKTVVDKPLKSKEGKDE